MQVALVAVAIVLGACGVPGLARLLLTRRLGPQPAQTTRVRLFCALALAAAMTFSRIYLEPTPGLFAVLGLAFMEAVLLCDLRARIIPWELCAGMLACALFFQLAADAGSELLASALLALVLVAALSLCNIASRHLSEPAAIGAGDLRLIPALSIFGGIQGSFLGMLACAVLMGASALVLLLMRRATPRSKIPLAPGLALWFVVGVCSCTPL